MFRSSVRLRTVLFFLLFFCVLNTVRSQTFELGVSVGASLYQGDLSEDNINFKGINAAYGAFVRYNINERFSVSGNFNTGTLQGSDANSSEALVRQRGFYFKSGIKELAILGEFNILPIDHRKHNYGFFTGRFSPYISAGFAFATTDGTPTAPADRIPYPFPEKNSRNTFISLAFGLGVKVQLTDEINAGFDFGWRPTLSDYLDGVSVNGNANRNDWYFFTSFKVSYLLDYRNR